MGGQSALRSEFEVDQEWKMVRTEGGTEPAVTNPEGGAMYKMVYRHPHQKHRCRGKRRLQAEPNLRVAKLSGCKKLAKR